MMPLMHTLSPAGVELDEGAAGRAGALNLGARMMARQ